jgi:CheY-like chemotaxis protein
MVNVQMKKILVVDDDLSIGEVLSLMLEMEGYSVVTLNSGRAGIEKIIHERPDLVLLDYFLPGEDAEEIIGKMRKKAGANLPIILMSASAQAERMAQKLAVNEFIPKPFQREILLEAIGRHLN